MNERERVEFYDTSSLVRTEGIEKRCDVGFLQKELVKRLEDDGIKVTSVKLIKDGKYVNKSDGFIMSLTKSYRMDGLPEFVEVRIDHEIDQHVEHAIVWSPTSWNDRFIGTGGGGTGVGGDNYIRRPDNFSRSQNLAFALKNGFTAATCDGASSKNNWAFDKKTNKIQYDLLENWHNRSTHFMTIIGKAVAEILHQREVKFSYFHGGSGGGRQAMVEAQDFPSDYNGIWASCPAMNWTKFLIAGYWPIAVMNSLNHILSVPVLEFFMNKAHEKAGGKEKYYRSDVKIELDCSEYVEQEYKKGKKISDEDCKVMQMIFDGPRREDGTSLCSYMRPGNVFWIKVLPLAAIYYPLFSKKPKAFFLCDHYASWVLDDPKVDLSDITIDQFIKLYDRSLERFPTFGADNIDLRPYEELGHKLFIDHGTDDPLIPVDGSINYFHDVKKLFGDDKRVDSFFKLFITPGDGHGNCAYHGAGITEVDGMKALISWVEENKDIESIQTIKGNNKGDIIYKSEVKCYK